MATVSSLATYAIFGGIGLLFGRRAITKPRTPWLIVLAILVLLSQWILTETRIISINDFRMYGNEALQAILLGILIGLLPKHTTQAQSLSSS